MMLSHDLFEEFARGEARAESWRYSKTALRALSQQEFVVADTSAALPAPLRAQFDWPQTQGRRLVFVNGAFAPQESDAKALLGADSAFSILHTGETTSIAIAPRSAGLIHLVFANMPGASASRWRRTLNLELRGGRAKILEHHLGMAGGEVLGALTSEIAVCENADLRIATLSDLPDSVSLYRRARARVAAAAGWRSTQALLGGRWQRFESSVWLEGERARCQSRGVFALRGRAHADTQLEVRHLARETVSDLLWRGIADQRAHGAFRGAIMVAPGADGSRAKLSNKNLLLSAQAEIDTQPVLEIHADEVEAAHGATVGQIDERALFYLRSRGITLAEARRMMVAAFCEEAFDGVAEGDLRERLAGRMREAVAS